MIKRFIRFAQFVSFGADSLQIERICVRRTLVVAENEIRMAEVAYKEAFLGVRMRHENHKSSDN